VLAQAGGREQAGFQLRDENHLIHDMMQPVAAAPDVVEQFLNLVRSKLAKLARDDVERHFNRHQRRA